MERIRFFLKPIAITAIWLWLFTAVGGAAPEEVAPSGGYLAGYETVDPRPTAVSWWSTLAYLFSLLLVFAIVVILAYFATRFVGGHFSVGTGDGGRILEQLPLSPKHSVCVVDLAGRVLVVGVAEHNVTLLTEINDKDEIERLRRQSAARSADGSSFNRQLGALTGVMQKIPPIFRK